MDAHVLLGMIAITKGKLEYNAQLNQWFYTIPVQFKRSIVGSGGIIAEAVEQAFKEWKDLPKQ